MLILGKAKTSQSDTSVKLIPDLSAGQWIWRSGVVIIAYLLLYYSAGYFIAWQNPQLAAFYGGSDPGSFFLQMQNILQNDPWLTPFQVLRSLLWLLFAFPVIRSSSGKTWQVAILVGLFIAVPMNIGHIMSNPLIPINSVRISHMIETASSNFVFGLILTWLFHQPDKLKSS